MYKCTTTQIDKDGNEIVKEKKKFLTLTSAIKYAKEMNSKKEHTHKVVSYKCTTCHKYHVGRNGSLITDKEREKFKKELERPVRFKVLGKIDLSTIPKK